MNKTNNRAISTHPALMTLIMLLWKQSINLRKKEDIHALFTVSQFEIEGFLATRKVLYSELDNDSINQIQELISYLLSFCLGGGTVDDLDLLYISDLESEVIIQGLNWTKHLFEDDYVF